MPVTDITIHTTEGECPAMLAKPVGDGPWPGVVLFMDGAGYRPHLASFAERLAANGYVALVPDTFYRWRPYAAWDPSRPFSEEDRRQIMPRIMKLYTPGVLDHDVAAFVDFLEADADVAKKPFGCTGYCMGGRVALTAAALYPEKFAAAAAFHPGDLATDEPNSVEALLTRIKARVLVAAAASDPFFTQDKQERFRAAFEASPVRGAVSTWPALHGWTMSDSPAHDALHAEKHWTELLNLFADTLQT
jgi:carboxymethylenebutenolidase